MVAEQPANCVDTNHNQKRSAAPKPYEACRDRAEGEDGMVGKRRSGRFTLKNERELIAMAANGATASEIAAKFKTSIKTIERKARALGISIKKPPTR
jgi:DNA-binding NarL/FixJ family response regulator